MGVRELQDYLEGLEAGCVAVDLFKIARNVSVRQQPHKPTSKIRPIVGTKLKLIMDAENCLDRLYGGYFSDWACGGQWNRMAQFVNLLTQAMNSGNIDLAVVFNGTFENCRMAEWIAQQTDMRYRVSMVLKHITLKRTPPPKIWWAPPICLRSALRMALRHFGITVMCTMDDHHQEVIAYCREYGFHGLLADDAEYAAFDPPRYFSSESLKLTYKGSLETKEFVMGELAKSLQLSQDQLCVMAALLGNFLLTEKDLQDVYKKLGVVTTRTRDPNKALIEANVKKMAEYIRTLPPPSNMDGLVVAVLGSLDDKRAARLRQSVQYYLNGTASGFLKYCAPPVNPKEKKATVNVQNNNVTSSNNEELDFKVGGFASETTEQEQESLEKYKLATVNSVLASEFALDTNNDVFNTKASGIPTEQNGAINGDICSMVPTENSALNSSQKTSTITSSTNNSTTSGSHVRSLNDNVGKGNVVTPTVSSDVLRTASLRHQKGIMESIILHVLTTQEVRLPCLMEDENNREFPPIHDIYLPLRKRVYAVLFNLHHLRYMHTKKHESSSADASTQNNVTNNENSPNDNATYDVNNVTTSTSLSPPSLPDIVVKEWIYTPKNPYQYPVDVKADPLPWAVPTLHRLWFGATVDDKRRRMRALLSCLNSDTPLILNPAYVPQHMLIMACVLRYIMSQDKPILRRNELDSFLCQAFNGDLMNPQFLQDITLTNITSRGVQLATLFMQGVKMALLANDACGAPIPWLMCCPWLYFDGKLFHTTLNRSLHSKNILDVCEGHIERVMKVERMRKAILEGLDVKFAKVPLNPLPFNKFAPQFNSWQRHNSGLGLMTPGPMGQHGQLMETPMSHGGSIGRGHHGHLTRSQSMPARGGGQLQVAGVVVGQWGPNFGYQNNNNPMSMRNNSNISHQSHPAYGSYGRGRLHPNNMHGQNLMISAGPTQHTNNMYHSASGGNNVLRGRQHTRSGNRNSHGPPTYPVNSSNTHNSKRNAHKKRNNTNKSNKNQGSGGHTLTVKTDSGDVPIDEIVLPNHEEDCVIKTDLLSKKSNQPLLDESKKTLLLHHNPQVEGETRQLLKDGEDTDINSPNVN